MTEETKGPQQTAEQKAELVQHVAESAADEYLAGIAGVLDIVPPAILIRRGFVDGFLTAIETLLSTPANAGSGASGAPLANEASGS